MTIICAECGKQIPYGSIGRVKISEINSVYKISKLRFPDFGIQYFCSRQDLAKWLERTKQ